MPAEKHIASLLRIAAEDLRGARVLLDAHNRNAAYLLEQAAEKTIRAVLVSEALHSSLKHELANFVDLIPDANPVKPLLRAVEHLAEYATTFRYPTSTKGLIKPPPPDDVLHADAARVETALNEVARRLGVDVSNPAAVATRPGPIR